MLVSYQLTSIEGVFDRAIWKQKVMSCQVIAHEHKWMFKAQDFSRRVKYNIDCHILCHIFLGLKLPKSCIYKSSTASQCSACTTLESFIMCYLLWAHLNVNTDESFAVSMVPSVILNLASPSNTHHPHLKKYGRTPEIKNFGDYPSLFGIPDFRVKSEKVICRSLLHHHPFTISCLCVCRKQKLVVCSNVHVEPGMIVLK